MKQNQKYTPKYWVVHDKETDDIFPSTMHKSKWQSEELFINQMTEILNFSNFEDARESYENNSDTYECILIEIKQVRM